MSEQDDRDVYATMDLALRVGEMLLSTGAGASDVAAQMHSVAAACGLRDFTADVTFTELAMSHQRSDDTPALVQLRQVRRREVDYDHLTDVDHLVRDLTAGRVDRAEAVRRLNRIVSTGHRRPRWAVTVGWGVMGAGTALVLAGNWLVVLIAFTGACLIDLVKRRLARRRLPSFYQQAAGGLIASLLAAAVAATGADLAPGRVITAGIILLLAGVSFLGAVQDALVGYPLTAGARLLEALMATAGVLGGVSGGITLARVAGFGLGTPDTGAITFSQLPLVALGAGIAAAAYAFASYAPVRSLLPIGLIAAVAGGIYLVAIDRGFGLVWASGLGALVIGLLSWPVSTRARVPALVVVTAAIVPLLPGLSLYRGLALFNTSASGGLTAMTTAVAVAIALGAGIILGEYVAQPLGREARRLESRLAGPRLVGAPGLRVVRRRRG